MERCNICGNSEFIDFNGRSQVQCVTCKSLERHRLVRWTLEELGYLKPEINRRMLHLAPEEMTHRYMAQAFGGGYICSDPFPEKYPHAQCLKLALPEGFDIFPKNYFDLILHNHVLEHIPGDYKAHLVSFQNLLRPSGRMVFTIPGISQTALSIQGGEFLSSDAERVRIHGQSDHYKSFGRDFIDFFSQLTGTLITMKIPDDIRTDLRATSDSIYIYTKHN